MDKKLFSVDDVNFIEAAILNAGGKSTEEKQDLAKKVKDALIKTYKKY